MGNPDLLKPLDKICDPDPRHKGFVIQIRDIRDL